MHPSLQLQNSDVAALTAGWDAFFKMLTGGASGFVTFNQDLATLSTDLKKAHGNTTGLTAASLTAQQQFLTTAQAAQTEVDNLTTMVAVSGMGVKGTDLLTRSTKDLIYMLLPAAKHSKTFTDILIGLAHQGGAPAITSFKGLVQWVGKLHNPMKDLQKNTKNLTNKDKDLTKDVQNLSTALGTTLNNAMSIAILPATAGTKWFTNLASSILGTGLNSKSTKIAAGNLASQMFTLTGNVGQAHNEFITFATVALHLTRQQADALWNESLP